MKTIKCKKNISGRHRWEWNSINPDDGNRYVVYKVAQQCVFCKLFKEPVKFMYKKELGGFIEYETN